MQLVIAAMSTAPSTMVKALPSMRDFGRTRRAAPTAVSPPSPSKRCTALLTSGARLIGRLHAVNEGALHVLEREAILRAARARERRLDGAEVELEQIGVLSLLPSCRHMP